MSEIAVRAENLGKRYRIGASRPNSLSFSQTVFRFIGSPFAYLRTTLRKPAENELIWALKDFSCEIREGEVVGFVGRNGAGKSTLLKLLGRITDPTLGKFELRGRVATLLEVGTGFHPDLTGRENIYVNGAMMGMSRQEVNARFDEIVAFAEMDKFIDTPVKYYSSGMYVRLGFAVAAHLFADIVLVDEVLAVGDFEFQKKCLGKMQDMAGSGRTVLFISHNMPAVQRLCSRGYLLDHGCTVMEGPIHDVVERYLGTSRGQSGERLWNKLEDAPGNEVVRLRSVRMKNRQGLLVNKFDVTDALDIEVEFSVLQPDRMLTISLYFYTEDGTLIFVVLDAQDPTWQEQPRPVGIHKSICHIPADLLNEGSFNVLVGITDPWVVHVIENDVITFKVLDGLKSSGARGTYKRDWPGGFFRPKLDWTFDYEAAKD